MGLAGKSMIKALMMEVFGLVLAIGRHGSRSGVAPFYVRPHGIHGRDRFRPGHHGLVPPVPKMTGAQFAMVHFAQGVASAMTAFLGGKIDVLCADVGDLLAQLKSGEVRISGIMDDETSPFYPRVKTFKQQGYKLYNSSSRGFAAPAGTPKPVVDVLSGAMKRVTASEDHKKRMADMGLTLRYMDPAQYSAYWSEYEKTITELLPLTKAKE